MNLFAGNESMGRFRLQHQWRGAKYGRSRARAALWVGRLIGDRGLEWRRAFPTFVLDPSRCQHFVARPFLNLPALCQQVAVAASRFVFP
jgi:hypothetical protein